MKQMPEEEEDLYDILSKSYPSPLDFKTGFEYEEAQKNWEKLRQRCVEKRKEFPYQNIGVCEYIKRYRASMMYDIYCGLDHVCIFSKDMNPEFNVKIKYYDPEFMVKIKNLVELCGFHEKTDYRRY